MNCIMKLLKGLLYIPDEFESNVVWTGPSTRVKDGESLLNSVEMKRDLDSAKKLKAYHENKNTQNP